MHIFTVRNIVVVLISVVLDFRSEFLLDYSENTRHNRYDTFVQNERFCVIYTWKLFLYVLYLFTDINSFTLKTQAAPKVYFEQLQSKWASLSERKVI